VISFGSPGLPLYRILEIPPKKGIMGILLDPVTEYVELVRALAWPLLVGGALVAFYRPLNQFIADVGKRLTKFSVWGMEVGLRSLVEGRIDALQQLRQADTFSSSNAALLLQLDDVARMDYAVIDFGSGDRWLTSRLFLFGVILEKLRGLRCFVFVDFQEGARRSFIGTATPNQIRWIFAEKFPWLEASLANEFARLAEPQAPEQPVQPLNAERAARLIAAFLADIQAPTPPPAEQDRWVNLPEWQCWEHAGWLTRESIRQYLSSGLGTSAVESWRTRPQREIAQEVLHCKDPFVALLDSQGEFSGLVDRHSLLEELAAANFT
jgi:hypothetical protein